MNPLAAVPGAVPANAKEIPDAVAFPERPSDSIQVLEYSPGVMDASAQTDREHPYRVNPGPRLLVGLVGFMQDRSPGRPGRRVALPVFSKQALLRFGRVCITGGPIGSFTVR